MRNVILIPNTSNIKLHQAALNDQIPQNTSGLRCIKIKEKKKKINILQNL